MKNTKMIKVGLIISFSLNYIYSDWCELCFSDYKEINQPDSNLAEEAQKIKESKNKAKNNGGTNIEKININGTKDESKTNYFNARKAKTKENCNTSECEIIPKDIEIDNRMLAYNSGIIPASDIIKDTENNSLKAETEIESPYPNDFNYNSNIDRNDYNSSLKDINTNTREDINTNTRKGLSNNREYFSSNTDENPMITDKKVYENNFKEEIAATNYSGNEEVAETNPKVDENYCRPETYNDGKE